MTMVHMLVVLVVLLVATLNVVAAFRVQHSARIVRTTNSRKITSSFHAPTHIKTTRLASSVPSFELNAKDLLMADCCSGLSRGEINELVLKLEKQNPTADPAYSPLLNGVWEVVSASLLTPGVLGLQVIKQLPGSFITVGDITITIQSISPRVKAQTTVQVGHMNMEVAVVTDLQAKTALRLSEAYETAAIGDFNLPLTSLRTFSRDIIVSYLDEDLMIARDSFGTPEILRRKDMFSNRQENSMSDISADAPSA